MSQKNQLKNQNKNQSLIYKKLSNRKKRQDYLNSLPTKKVSQYYLKRETRYWLANCEEMAKHPLRKNFPKEKIWITRFVNANVFELVQVIATYSKENGATYHEPEILERKLVSHPQYIYNNTISCMGKNIRPKYPTAHVESLIYYRFNTLISRATNHIINKYTPFKNHLPNHVLSSLRFSELTAPHTQTIYEYCPELLPVYLDYYRPGNTLLQTFNCFDSKAELHQFFKYFKAEYAIPNMTFNFSIYKDFVYECKKRKENYLIVNWWKRHDEHIEENNKLAEAQRKNIDRKLKFVKNKLFKMSVKEWDIYFKKPKTQKELKEIGKKMSNCVGGGSYKAKDIIVAYVNSYMICLEYKRNKIQQIYTYKNADVPTKYRNLLEKEVRKWTKNLTS